MVSFILSLVALILGYLLYGRFVEKVFGPDDRLTPAVAKADGVDYLVLPGWKIFMIQFLNIAGTGPIFGAILGAKFGPVAYLWIVLGCIFAGATHDYLSGMLSMRNDGASLPELIGKYLGRNAKMVMLAFTVLLLIMVGTVFVYSPAEILHSIWGSSLFWIIVIFAYYVIATMLPIDKIIGKIYPLFAFSLLFMAGALMVMLFVKMPQLPELWTHFYNMGAEAEPEKWTDQIFPCLFITIACGAISGFHATQSPLMARCVKSEHMGRPIFYGAMITEGVVALIWATVSSWFFYGSPAPGYELIAAVNTGFSTSAPAVVNIVCNDWLGVAGAILALLGVVAAPITSGDTAFRSARLIIGEWLHIDQRPIIKRLAICLPLFISSIAMLVWQIENPDGFNIIWQYFGWANQTLSVFTLWTLTVYLVRQKKPYIITLIPALLMTTVCTTFLFVSKQAFHLPENIGYLLGILCLVVGLVWFIVWYRKEKSKLV
ncbi:carbon starvation protein A [Prevotella sp. P3-120]|uniref:carbon starvation CstA family protein n=1 Tax=unclassified Prevotella TaxID=2638335 RepID=UPI000B95E8F9|nr:MULTISPECIES: carbon starvation protein A [unclassified Prevotella]OYP51885.1 carbon starvation protein A [Prevotella sp. P3-120]OYP53141.1 carbon starvation protein A [Prevotella sp. P3-92]